MILEYHGGLYSGLFGCVSVIFCCCFHGMKMFIGIVFVSIFLLSLTAFIYAIYCFYRAITNLRPDKTVCSNLFAPLAIFIPALFTDVGERYRRRFFIFLLVGAAALTLVLVIKVMMKPA